MVPIDQIDPNPNQPRQVMGDLSELMASIAEKGIIEPLIVRQRGARFQIIAGERRYQAAVQVGLREMPVVIREVDDNEIIEIALIENIQRKDLTPFEEAEALQSLATRCGYTHEDMARRLGKSRTSITESLSLNGMPEEVKNLCRLADIHSKSLLLQIVRQGDPQKMVALVEKIARDGGDDARGRPQRDRQAQARPAEGVTSSATRRPPRRSTCSCGSPSHASNATKSSRRSRPSSKNCAQRSSSRVASASRLLAEFGSPARQCSAVRAARVRGSQPSLAGRLDRSPGLRQARRL